MSEMKTLTVNGQTYTLRDANAARAIVCQAQGSAIALSDSAQAPLEGLTLYGKTVQSGTPTPEAPVPLESAGDSGTINTTVRGKNLWNNAKCTLGNSSALARTETGAVFKRGTSTGGSYVCLTVPVYKGQTVTFSAKGSTKNPLLYLYKEKIYATALKQAESKLTYTAEEDLPNATFTVIINSTDGDCEFSNIQIEFGSEVTRYEAYKEAQTLTVSTPKGLPGIPVPSGGNYTDEAGQQYLANYRDYARGVEESIEALRLDGTEYWSTGFAGNARYFVLNLTKPSRYRDCHMNTHGYAPAYGAADGNLYFAGASLNQLFIYPGTEKYTSVDAWKAQLAQWSAAGTPFTVLYAPVELGQTPIPEEELAAYAALHSNYPNTIVYNDAGAYMALSYVADTKAYIDNKLAALA